MLSGYTIFVDNGRYAGFTDTRHSTIALPLPNIVILLKIIIDITAIHDHTLFFDMLQCLLILIYGHLEVALQ